MGSEGPHVTILQAFLCGAKLRGNTLIFDGDYGPVTAEKLKLWQGLRGIEDEENGQYGPVTRLAMLDCGFDFEVACRTIPGTTIFVQPDGTQVAWSPDGD
jgi:hypothetical protein